MGRTEGRPTACRAANSHYDLGQEVAIERALGYAAGNLLSRRQFVTGVTATGLLALYATLPAPVKAALKEAAGSDPDSPLTEGQRLTLRGLADAVVPGTWDLPGVWEPAVEDWLEDGSPAPGADDANVQEWIEQTAGTLPPPLDWLTTGFLGAWADDLDLWAAIVHFPFNPKFWQLPLWPSVRDRGRQRKIILMQSAFGSLFELKYQAGVVATKVAFYCDLWFEVNEPQTRVGREYIGFPLPPGTTPYSDFTYNRVLGDHDKRLIEVNPTRHLIVPP